MAYRQWIGTISAGTWTVPTNLEAPTTYLKGQKEIGEGGYEHYQLIAYFSSPVRLSRVQLLLNAPSAHFEKTRSKAAEAYVWKEATRVPGSQFELGRKVNFCIKLGF